MRTKEQMREYQRARRARGKVDATELAPDRILYAPAVCDKCAAKDLIIAALKENICNLKEGGGMITIPEVGISDIQKAIDKPSVVRATKVDIAKKMCGLTFCEKHGRMSNMCGCK